MRTFNTICISKICAWSGSFPWGPFAADAPAPAPNPGSPGLFAPSLAMCGTMLGRRPPLVLVEALNLATYSKPCARSVAKTTYKVI